MQFWRLITHHKNPDDALDWYQKHNVIALGWGNIGNLQGKQQVNNQHDIAALYNNAYPKKNAGECGRCLWDFWNVMAIGDLVILGKGKGHRFCVVKVVDDYFFSKNYPPNVNAQMLDDYYHRRAVVPTNHNVNNIWKQHAQAAHGANIRHALCQLT